MIYLSRSPRNSQGFEESTPSNKTTGEILSPNKLGTYEHSSLGRLAPSIVRCLPRRAFTWLVLLDWFQPFRPVFLAVLFSFFLHLPQIIFLHALPPFTFAIWSFLAYDYLDLTHLFSPLRIFFSGWLPSDILFPAKRGLAIKHRYLHGVLQLFASHHSSPALFLSRRLYFGTTLIGTTATDQLTALVPQSCIINVI